MRLKQLSTLMICAVLFATSCKKDSGSSSSNTVTVSAGGAISFPTGTSGACYSIVHRKQMTGSFVDFHTASAWFEDYSTVASAGTVSCNAVNLNQYVPNTWYTVMASDLFDLTDNKAEWVIQGNPAKSIPAFTHTDAAAFTSTVSFSTPSAVVNTNSNLTITHSALPSNVMVVIYGLQSTTAGLVKTYGYVGNSATSFTFPSADLKAMATPPNKISVSIMPVVMTSAVYGGKTYYFVKQFKFEKDYTTM